MSATEKLIQHLEGVRQTAPDQFIACCPAHADKSASLSIKRVDDRVLVHCFAGCPIDEVLSAVGLGLGDLFDQPKTHRQPPVSDYQRRRTAQAYECLEALTEELAIVMVAAHWLASQRTLTPVDLDRLDLAHERIIAALTLVMGEAKTKRPSINEPKAEAA